MRKPRIARNLLGGIFSHHITQGINREYIFKTKEEKEKYLSLIERYYQEYNILILAYCIMDNHTHLLIYAEDTKDISNFMAKINMKYAYFYNHYHKRIGYVFRDRFYSKPINSQNQLLKCMKYIHMNPVRAKIVKNEEDYNFSSYHCYIQKNQLINSKTLNLIFGTEKDYLKKFKEIEYEEKTKDNLEFAIEKFIIDNKISKIILKEEIWLKKLISYLITNQYEFTKTELAKQVEISRAQFYRIIKNDKK